MAIARKVKDRLPYIAAVFALLPSAWIEFINGNLILAIVLLFIIFLNIIALRSDKTFSLHLNITLHFMNAVAMFIMALQFFKTGKTYLHIPYFLACIGFLIAGIIYAIRFKRSNGNHIANEIL